jgi:hypothetical protein
VSGKPLTTICAFVPQRLARSADPTRPVRSRSPIRLTLSIEITVDNAAQARAALRRTVRPSPATLHVDGFARSEQDWSIKAALYEAGLKLRTITLFNNHPEHPAAEYWTSILPNQSLSGGIQHDARG